MTDLEQHDGGPAFPPPCSQPETEGRVSEATGIEAEVFKDIAVRQHLGIAKYGTTIADNPLTRRQWLQHAYEECLDQAVYLKKCIAKEDANESAVALAEQALRKALPILENECGDVFMESIYKALAAIERGKQNDQEQERQS